MAPGERRGRGGSRLGRDSGRSASAPGEDIAMQPAGAGAGAGPSRRTRSSASASGRGGTGRVSHSKERAFK